VWGQGRRGRGAGRPGGYQTMIESKLNNQDSSIDSLTTFLTIHLLSCSDDQKEKCREAAKIRRTKESEYFKELENVLPLPKQVHDSDETHLDKNSLMRYSDIVIFKYSLTLYKFRFSIAYLKTREVINTGIRYFLCHNIKMNPLIGYLSSSLEKEQLPEVDILSCLAGFTLVLGPDGDVIYTCDNITRYLGISPVS
jgi:hypothetical protein